ncbi:hypothetical protein RZS08_00375, partial [Arthrospira platensis SPKY1]|nr:hypothetical protein [Arthrospira platensis SPKY1]
MFTIGPTRAGPRCAVDGEDDQREDRERNSHEQAECDQRAVRPGRLHTIETGGHGKEFGEQSVHGLHLSRLDRRHRMHLQLR